VADKKITPKAAEAKAEKKSDEKATTRVTKHRNLSRRARSRRRV